MYQNLFKENKKTVVSIAAIHIYLVTLFEGYIFRIENYYMDRMYIFCKILSVYLIYIVWKKIMYKLGHIKETGEKCFVVAFIIYYFFMLLVLWLTWPGAIVYDVNILLKMAETLEVAYFFVYITSVFYFVSYMMMPMILAPIFLLNGLMAYVFAKLFSYLYVRYAGKKYVYFSIVPFVLNSVIFNNLQPHRLQFFTVVAVYLLLDMYIVFDSKIKTNYKMALKWIVISSVLAVWRTEGICFLIFVLLYLLLLENKKSFMYAVKVCLVTVVVFAVIKFPQYNYESTQKLYSEKRSLPNDVYLIANMLNYDEDSFTDEEKATLNKVSDLERACTEVTVYHINSGYAKDFSLNEYKDFKKILIKGIFRNWGVFLDIKWKAFMGASALDKNHVLYCTCTYDPEEITVNYSEAAVKFPKLRSKITSALEGHAYGNRDCSTVLYHVSYNILIPVTVLLLALIYSIHRKELFCFFATGMLLGMCCIVAFTAPASHFKYYYYIYLSGYSIAVIGLANIFYKRK